MASKDHIELEGIVVQCGTGGTFRVECENHVVNAKVAGRLRKNHIRIVMGDRVTVAVSPYDAQRGLITFRHK